METNIVVDISPPIPYLAKFWFSSYGPKRCKPIKLQGSLKCNISRKKWMIKFIFGKQINIKVFYKVILIFWVWEARHAQSTQNKKVAYLCNISRKACGMKLIFLSADKCESFLQVDSISLGVHGQACPKYPRQQVYNVFAVSQGKSEEWSWFFVCR